MSKLIAFTAVLAAVLLPAAANAATSTKLSGVVVSKETTRHTLVVASPHGKLTTVRATTGELRATRLGSRIAAWGSILADGSLHATRVTRSGATKHALIRATVLKTHGTTLLLAGGGSAFAVRLARGTRVAGAARNEPSPGEQVEADVELSHGELVGNTVQDVGTSVLVDFSGKITALDTASLTVKSDGETTTIAIPDGVSLPSLVQVGTEVEIVASVSGSTLTLVEVKVDGDSAKNGDDGGSNVDGDSTVHVEGFVTTLDAASITIQPGDSASPITFAIPDGFTLPAGLSAGSAVEARGDFVNATLTLTRLEVQSGDGDSGKIETEGTVTELDAGSITIQPAENGTPVTFAIPEGFSLPGGLQVGSAVSAKGELVNSVATLTKLELEDGGGDGGGDG